MDKKKIRKPINVANIISYILLITFCAYVLIPFVMVVFTAFKTTYEINDMPNRNLLHRILPDSFSNVSNIVSVWNGTASQLNGVPFYRFIINSLIVTLCSLFPSIILAVTAAYGLAKYNFPGKNIIFYCLLGLVMIPMEMISIPLFMMVSKVHLVNSYIGMMIPSFISAFGTFLLKESMEPIPNSYIEAARIDGAGELHILRKIIIPMITGSLVTFIVIKCTWAWNELFWPLLVVSTEDKKTVTLGLAKFSNDLFKEYGQLNAAVLISIVPLLVIFIFAHNKIKTGLMGSGIKG